MNIAEDQRKEIILPGLSSLRVEPECVVVRKERAPFAEALADALGCSCVIE